MLFHLGALWRLNEAGYLPRLERISSVSGGSMTSGVLALAWDRLDFDENGVARRFQEAVVDPLRKLAGKTVDVWAIVLGILLPGSIGNWFARSLKRNLLGHATLQDLPDRPQFVFNATNVHSAVLWRRRSRTCATTSVGEVEDAAHRARHGRRRVRRRSRRSSHRCTIKVDAAAYTPGSGLDLQRPPFTDRRRPHATAASTTTSASRRPGSVRDRAHRQRRRRPDRRPKPTGRDWARAARSASSTSSTTRCAACASGRRSAAFVAGRRKGAYWGIRSDIARIPGLPTNAARAPHEETMRLAEMPTRLAAARRRHQERLINWGYAVCDAGMRRHIDPRSKLRPRFPYPASGVG